MGPHRGRSLGKQLRTSRASIAWSFKNRRIPQRHGRVYGRDSLTLLQAIRASGCDDPVVIVAAAVSDEMWTASCSDNAEILVTPYELESSAPVPLIRRAIDRVEPVRENRRLDLADRRRLNRERDEAERLLNQQRQIIHDIELLAEPGEEPADRDEAVSIPLSQFGTPPALSPNAGRVVLPPEVNEYYQELLRTYVIMGSGNLGTEIAKLAELLEHRRAQSAASGWKSISSVSSS